MIRAIALIPAAGVGRRFGGDRHKAFVELDGRPLLFATIERLQAATLITDIVVALHATDLPAWESLPGRPEVIAVAGGETRAHSVGFALDKAVAVADGQDFVACVHDAARPWVDPVQVDEVVRAASISGAAGLYRPVTDTIKQRHDGGALSTPPRSALHAMQTPQAIRSDLFREAYKKWRNDGEPEVTDDLQMIEGSGIRVELIEGVVANRKITFPEDLNNASPT